MRARRKGNHHVPVHRKNERLEDRHRPVVARPFGRQQVAAPGIMAAGKESIADDSRKLASNQDFHSLSSGAGAERTGATANWSAIV